MIVDGGKLLKLLADETVDYDLPQYELTPTRLKELMVKCSVPIQPPARIEAAIRKFDSWGAYQKSFASIGDFGRWILGQPQDTWKPKDFGLEEEK